MTTVQAAQTEPVGTLVLQGLKKNLALRNGHGRLLRVIG
jgi:hypothetical protein